jgi:hypothetical protein
MRSSISAAATKGSVTALNSARGSFLMLFIMFLAGVFLIFSSVVPIYFIDQSIISSQMQSVKNLFNHAFSIYMVFIVFASALGLASYLLSYILIGAPLRLIRWFTFKVLKFKVIYGYSALASFSGIGKYLRTEEDERYAAFLRLSEETSRHASDVRFLFVQLMFARSAFASAIFSTWFVPKAVGYETSPLVLVLSWVCAMAAYAVGHNLYNRTLFISWVLQFENKKERTQKEIQADGDAV